MYNWFWHVYLQDDQLYMAVLFLYLVKSDLSSLHVYSSVYWTSHQENTAMFNWSPCLNVDAGARGGGGKPWMSSNSSATSEFSREQF